MNIPITFSGLKQQMIQTNKSKESIRAYENQISVLNDFMIQRYNVPIDLEDIKLEDIEAYIHYLQHERQWKVASVNLSISAARKLFGFAERKGWIKENIMKHIQSSKKQPVERDFLNEEEVTRLIEAIDHPLVRLVVRTLALTGLRISECIHLTLDDVDFEKGIIRVINGKGGKNRIVPIAKELADNLLYYKDILRPQVKSPSFFALKKTGAISQQYINRELKNAAKNAGIDKNVSCHTLRHSFASALVRKGTNLPTVAKLLGHADFRTVTSIYVHTDQSELTEAVNLLTI